MSSDSAKKPRSNSAEESGTRARRERREYPRLHACPLCYQVLDQPGLTAGGWPLALPAAEAVQAVGANVDDERLTVEMANGATISVPTSWSSRLLNASPQQRSAVVTSESGESLHWSEIDEDIGVSHLLGIPEDVASAARGASIHPPPSQSPVIHHVLALLLVVFRAEAAALRKQGLVAHALRIRSSGGGSVTLTVESGPKPEGSMTVLAVLAASADGSSIEVSITDDDGGVLSQIGSASVDETDAGPVAFALARAGIARLGARLP